VIFRTGALPILSNGRLRNRFFEYFFTEKVKGVVEFLKKEAGCSPGLLKNWPAQRTVRMPNRRNWPPAKALPLMRLGAATAILACLGGCTGANSALYPAGPGTRTKTVYVVHHGSLHTGLAVRRSDIPPGLWPASHDFARSKYLEVGWGDDDGYRKPLTSAIAVKALMGSNRTVVLADGFIQRPEIKYGNPKFTVLAVELSGQGFARLCQHIEQTYASDSGGRPIRLGDGWYRGRGRYSGFNTCNTWVAAGLNKAGCPISPALCSMPGQLLGRVRSFARSIHPVLNKKTDR
jgi:hypothetical protein